MAKSKKGIRGIVISDLHLERWKQHNEGNRRLTNGLDVLKQIKKKAIIYKCPILFAGDLFHKEKHLTNSLIGDTFPTLSKIFNSPKVTTYAITGNHDQSQPNTIERESPSYIKTLSKIFKGLECMDFKTKQFDDWSLSGIPYLTHDLGLIDKINEMHGNTYPDKVNILMLHTTMPNTKDTDGRSMVSHLGENDFEKAVGKFDIVLCGHIHKPMSFKIGHTDVIQVGAPQQQRFTDRNCEMGYWVIHKHFEMEFVPFDKYPKFIELEEGQEKPDNKNFYVTRPKKRETDINEVSKNNFNTGLSGNKLARNYCKEKGIKDKEKKKALKETLKNSI